MTMHLYGLVAGAAPDGATLANAALGGGQFGWTMLRMVEGIVGPGGAPVVLIVLWLVSFLLLSGKTVVDIVDSIKIWFAYRAKDVEDRVVEARQNRPVTDIDRGDGLVIRGLGQKKKQRAKDPLEDTDPELEIELPPPPRKVAANANAQRAPIEAPPIVERAPIKINTPQSRASELNKVPPPRIIGAQPVVAAKPTAQQPLTRSTQARRPPLRSPRAFRCKRDWQLPNIATLLDPGNDASLKEVGHPRARGSDRGHAARLWRARPRHRGQPRPDHHPVWRGARALSR